MASPAAVENVRKNRESKRQWRRRKEEERLKFEQGVAVRMTARFYPDLDTIPLMLLNYRYWQMRRCGWDAMSKRFAIDLFGRPVDPHDGVTWNWWCRIHWSHREKILAMTRIRLVRGA
jgi:hypothetical protein